MIRALADRNVNEDMWLEARRSVFTASDIPSICGLKGSEPLINMIVAKLEGTQVPDNYHMTRGRLSESFIFHKCCTQNDIRADRFTPNTTLWYNDKYPLLAATPDYIGKDECVEVKSPERLYNNKLSRRYEPSTRYLYQLAAQMLVLEKPRGILMVGSLLEQKYKAFLYKDMKETQAHIRQSLAKVADLLKQLQDFYAADL